MPNKRSVLVELDCISFFSSLYSVNEVISFSSPLCRSVPEGVALAQPEAAAFIQAQAHAVGAVVAPERLAGAAAVPHDVPDVNMVAGAGNVNAGGADIEGAGMVAAAVVTEREGVDRRNGGDLQENWGRGGGGHAATGMLGEAEATLDVNAAASGIDAMDLVTSDMERDYLQQQQHHHLHQNHNQRRNNNQFGRNERVSAPFE